MGALQLSLLLLLLVIAQGLEEGGRVRKADGATSDGRVGAG